MATLSIPFDPSFPSQEFRTVLEGATYVLILDWNGREGYWYLSILDGDGDALLRGQKVVEGVDFLFGLADTALPPGLLASFDTALQSREAGRLDLGEQNLLIYREEAEA